MGLICKFEAAISYLQNGLPAINGMIIILID